MYKKICTTFLLFGIYHIAIAQSYFSGDLELRSDFYVRDTTIGAAGTPQYDNQKSSMDSWLSSSYRNENWGLSVGLRMDFFVNSRLHKPTASFTKVNLGNFYVKKEIKGLTVTGGHFYDQFGSGIAFRAYEDRFLGIDNSIFGIHAKYDFTKNFSVKAFGGLPNDRLSKNVIGTSGAFVKGINGEGLVSLGKEKDLTIRPGASVVNRTISQDNMNTMVNNINGYPNFNDRFKPVFNTYIFSAYNTLNYKNFSWYVEGAYKTREAVKIAVGSPYKNTAGNIIYTNLTYSQKGFGITAQFKRTQNFQFRDAPDTDGTILNGALNFIPPINRQNSVRLAARYAPASQEISEVAYSFDITKKLSKKIDFHFTYSEIHDLDISFKYWAKTTLFREFNADIDWRASKKVKGEAGVQYVLYNKEFYEGPSGYDRDVQAITPYFELTYKFDNKKSLRTELQYQYVPRDFGQWLFVLAEFSMAPNFTISLADQWNIVKGENKSSKNNEHYYSVFSSYTIKTTRFFASYVRQVEGIVCTGGVCRLEPSFNGVKVGLNTSF